MFIGQAHGGAVELLVEQLAVRSRLGERLVVGEVDDVLLDVGLGRGRVLSGKCSTSDAARRLVISSAEIPSTASVPAVEPACAWVTDEKLPEPSGLTPKYAAASRHASVQTPIRASLQLRVSFWFMRRSSLSGMASPFDGKLIFQAIVSAGVVFWVCESPRFPNGKRGLTERRCYLRLSE